MSPRHDVRTNEGQMEWMVAACRVSSGFLSNPTEFLSNPDSRAQPSWACGVVVAANESLAYEAGLDAWDQGLLTGQQPGDAFINWYVAPLAVVDPRWWETLERMMAEGDG